MSVILVAGAINTDLVATVARAPEAGETVTGHGFAIHGGGKGANQAVAAARSGSVVALIGAVGDDDFGKARLADLVADGIDVSRVATTRLASSGVALITVEERGENRISYIPGATQTIDVDAAISALEAISPTVVLAPNELRPEVLLALFTRARDIGAEVILNAAPDPEQAIQLLSQVDVLIANLGEALAMTGLPGDGHQPQEILEALGKLGPSCVAITLGGDGLIGIDNGTIFKIEAQAVEVVDTTGAGDTFCGALAASMVQGNAFYDAAIYASVAASLSVTRAGAQSSIPRREEIEQALLQD